MKDIPDIVKEIIGSFANASDIRDADLSSDELIKAKFLGDTWTLGVQTLKQWPDKSVSALSNDIWDVCHNNYVRVGVGPNVPTVSVAIVPPNLLSQMGLPHGTNHECVVFLPLQWDEMVEDDAVLQLGAILHAGSQAVDFYNNRHKIDPQYIPTRAMMYEAMYVKTLPMNVLNDYQKNILEFFTSASELISEILYTRKRVEFVS